VATSYLNHFIIIKFFLKIEILDESTGEMIIKDINSTDSLLCKINEIDNHVITLFLYKNCTTTF
jgi:hypothetical protein